MPTAVAAHREPAGGVQAGADCVEEHALQLLKVQEHAHKRRAAVGICDQALRTAHLVAQ